MLREFKILQKEWFMYKYILFLVAMFTITPIQAEPVVTIGTFLRDPLSNSQHTGMMDQLTIETLSRIGLQAKIVPLPAQRSLTLANAGDIDGDILRVANMERKYPNLIPVKEKMMTFDFVAFTRNRSYQLSNWRSLKRYRVALIKGWKILEVMTVDGVRIKKVLNEKELFKLLAKNKVDLVLYERYEGLALAKEMGMDDIHVIEPPLTSRPMYLYLHKKHASYATKAAKALKEMKHDGTYAAIIKKTLQGFQ
jgi:polar amino acid transport system substrate-binding protein